MATPIVKLTAVGDIMLGELPLTYGFGVRGVLESNPHSYLFQKVRHILKSADICFGNLECVLSDYGYNPNDLVSAQMRGTPYFANILARAGFNVLSVANNHIMQHGEKAFIETLKVLTFNNIVPIGVANNTHDATPQFIEIRGVTFCFLGYSFHAEKYSSNPMYAQGRKKRVVSAIEQNIIRSDVVVVSLHWGDEFMEIPSSLQIKDAHDYIDAGATLILGHHPHIVQGIEEYKHGIIAYSLGNFAFDFWQESLKKSLILECYIEKQGLSRYHITPIYINANYQPEVQNLHKRVDFLYHIGELSERLNEKSSIEFQITTRNYTKLLAKKNLINKIQNRIFFLRNINRYGFRVVFRSLLGFIQRRLVSKKTSPP